MMTQDNHKESTLDALFINHNGILSMKLAQFFFIQHSLFWTLVSCLESMMQRVVFEGLVIQLQINRNLT